MTSRTRPLLKIALVILILLGPRELWVVRDGQVSSTATSVAAKDSRPLFLPEVSMASKLGLDDDVYDAVDFYGNEVTAAVATYKLDGTGALYELHSPQTELPQLPPPKS